MDAKAVLEEILKTSKQLAQQGLQKGQELAPELLDKGKSIAQEGLQKSKQLGEELAPELMEKGKAWAQKGLDFAEQKLGVPAEGPEREAMLSGLGKGALVAGVLTALLGTDAGRRVTGTTVKLGSLGALGGLAYQAYQRWQTAQSGELPALGQPVHELTGAEADRRSQTLLQAIIAAAKADGHIDDQERAHIQAQINQMGLATDTAAFFQAEIDKPLSIPDLAQAVTSPEEAMEIYLASRLIIDVQNNQEKVYLSELASQLKLDPGLVQNLEEEVISPAAETAP
jgi:uncharacterized membrane protein YebE (DUF533 family)